MFVSCGYDTYTGFIAEMDVNQSAEMNDIDKILDYVKKTFPQDHCIQRGSHTRSL